jgi:hypothetical protein
MKDITERFRVLRERIDTTTLDDKRETFQYGLREFSLSDGRHMNMLDDEGNSFEIVATGEHVKRV